MAATTATSVPAINELVRAGRIEEALAASIELARCTPDDPVALNLLGVLLHRSGQSAEAATALEKAVQLSPGFAEARLNLGIVQQTRGLPAEAADQFRTLVLLNPQHAMAEERLGSVLHSQGDLEGADRHLRRLLHLRPGNPDSLYQLAVVLVSRGDFDEATDLLASIRSVAPDHADALALLGQVWLAVGAPDKAAATFNELAVRRPDHSEVRTGMARAGLYQRVAADSASTARGLPDGYVVRGPFSVLSGYGDLAQRFVRAMLGQGAALRLIGLREDETWRPERPEGGVPTDAPLRAAASLSFLTPALTEPIPGLPTVNYTMFEGPRVPRFWARCNAAHHDLVVVPTDSSRLAWIAAGYPADRLRVCPPGIEPHPGDLREPSRHLAGPTGRLIADYRVRMLNISDFIARKNIDGLLRVWLRATRADDDAILILKVGKGGPTLAQDLSRLFDRTARHVGRGFDKAAPIAVLTSRLDEAGMSTLYALATHYWSLSHGEGWDLPLTRAGARGAALIAPAHSAYTAYLDETAAHLIPAGTGPALMPYSRAAYPPFHGLDWWHPDEDAATDILARIIRDPDAERRDARSALTGRFTWNRAASTLSDIMEEARGMGRGMVHPVGKRP
ncbi:tetratricopeptide repeat protein (plasmid) [Azospirillum sp. 412522]|nr:tetratricopeptide repeat protein [Azospirillum sp. 412522]MBY6266384.1 tetratricopeptide repeat protein [Azospirillum sp. 412522]